jgi:hypothetical protein
MSGKTVSPSAYRCTSGFVRGSKSPYRPPQNLEGISRLKVAAARPTLPHIVIGGLGREDERICVAERVSALAERLPTIEIGGLLAATTPATAPEFLIPDFEFRNPSPQFPTPNPNP